MTDGHSACIDDIRTRLAQLGLALPTLYLPCTTVNLHQWAVIACDQFTNDPHYWQQVAQIVHDAPSTLHYIIPEIYLDSVNVPEAARNTRQKMHNDIANGILQNAGEKMMCVSRTSTDGRERRGLLFAFDLERYHYQYTKSTLIQATEATFPERIVPRRALRQQTDFELPHILILYDDPNHIVHNSIGLNTYGAAEQNAHTQTPASATTSVPTTAAASATTPAPRQIYTAELMLGGGKITGYAHDQPSALLNTVAALEQLHRTSPDRALFFVGDGNHSFAAAKEHWRLLKESGADARTHPARYALAELVNIHDPGLTFEPIHKYLTLTDTADAYHTRTQALFAILAHESRRITGELPAAERAHAPKIHFSYQKRTITCAISPAIPADVLLEKILSHIPTKKYPYTMAFAHTTEEIAHLDTVHTGIAVTMPPLNRHIILNYIATHGSLPTKSFSLGRAQEKRYYMECRKIT